MTRLDRRRTLSLAGVGLAALAGCSALTGRDDDGTADSEPIDGDDLPSYASLLPETDRSPYFYGAIDVETMTSLLEGSDDDSSAGEAPTDPLVTNPIGVAYLCSSGLSLLANSRAGDAGAYSAADETPDGEATFVYAGGVYALVGQYDRDALETALEEAGYDRLDADGAYATFTDHDTAEVVGVSERVYAFAYPDQDDDSFDPERAIERTLATEVGEREPKHATDDEFEWLLGAGGTSGITLGLTSSDPLEADPLSDDQADDGSRYAFDAYEGAVGAHQHLTVEGDDASAGAVVSYSDADAVDRDRLEAELGTEADTVDVTTDGAAVRIEAEYAGDVT